jgi:hypothetical protein
MMDFIIKLKVFRVDYTEGSEVVLMILILDSL